MMYGLVSALTLAPRGGAQSATVVGAVTANGHAVSAAEVTLVGTRYAARTNDVGEYRIAGATPGRYVLSVRVVGYQRSQDTITIGPSDMRRDVVLVAEPARLESAVSEARSPGTSTSLQISGFDSTPTTNAVRYRIEASVLRISESRMLADLLGGNFVDLRFERQNNGAAFAYSAAVSPLHDGPPPSDRHGRPLPAHCYVSVYMNGRAVYEAGPSSTDSSANRPPDLNEYRVSGLAGVEFYPSGVAPPAAYRSSGCGVVLLWPREQ